MIHKLLDIITFKDLENLVEQRTPEGRTLDYKRDLPGREGLNEFLKDVTSFANAAGGLLIFGADEERDENGKATGIPESIRGLQDFRGEQDVLQLENCVRDSTDPRVSVHFRLLEEDGRDPVLIAKIPRSWNGPHRYTSRNSQFYSRNAAGKYALDTAQIGQEFLASGELEKSIRNFRDDRIAKIYAGQTPVPMASDQPRATMLVVPMETFASGEIRDPQTLKEVLQSRFGGRAGSPRFNLDGIAISNHSSADQQPARFYAQAFRNCAIEVTIECRLRQAGSPDKRGFASAVLEQDLLESALHMRAALKDMELAPPFFVFTSLLQTKGVSMWGKQWLLTPFDRDVLQLPELTLTNFDDDLDTTIRPVFDALWQAAGEPSSPNYINGRWRI